MLDRHDAQDGHEGRDLPHRDAAGENSLSDRPMADREVPLPGAPATLALHQWLDGDGAEAEARRVDGKQVDLWNRIATETDRRRRMTTPAHVADRIMAALPDTALDTRLDARTATTATLDTAVRTVQGFSTTTVMVIGAGFFALGLLVGNTVLR